MSQEADTPWAVSVLGHAQTHEIVVTDDDEGVPGPPFTEDSARHMAGLLNDFFARGESEMRAVVLHHGVPVNETAVA